MRGLRLDSASRQVMSKRVGDRREGGREVGRIEVEACQIPLHPHQEQPELGVLVLVGVQDVGVVPEQEVGDGCDQPLLVGAGQQQNGGVAHGGSRRSGTGFCAIITKNPLLIPRKPGADARSGAVRTKIQQSRRAAPRIGTCGKTNFPRTHRPARAFPGANPHPAVVLVKFWAPSGRIALICRGVFADACARHEEFSQTWLTCPMANLEFVLVSRPHHNML